MIPMIQRFTTEVQASPSRRPTIAGTLNLASGNRGPQRRTGLLVGAIFSL
jgi:hypothetical protein